MNENDFYGLALTWVDFFETFFQRQNPCLSSVQIISFPLKFNASLKCNFELVQFTSRAINFTIFGNEEESAIRKWNKAWFIAFGWLDRLKCLFWFWIADLLFVTVKGCSDHVIILFKSGQPHCALDLSQRWFVEVRSKNWAVLKIFVNKTLKIDIPFIDFVSKNVLFIAHHQVTSS